MYSDDAEKLFDSQRAILLNGITQVAERPDILERALLVNLPRIQQKKRVAESDLWKQFDAVAPRILGALLDAVSAAIRGLPDVRLDNPPRMIDYARWATAAEPGLGWRHGDFMAAYSENRAAATREAVESAAIGPVLVAMVDRDGEWSGTASDLLDELTYGGLATDEMR